MKSGRSEGLLILLILRISILLSEGSKFTEHLSTRARVLASWIFASLAKAAVVFGITNWTSCAIRGKRSMVSANAPFLRALVTNLVEG